MRFLKLVLKSWLIVELATFAIIMYWRSFFILTGRKNSEFLEDLIAILEKFGLLDILWIFFFGPLFVALIVALIISFSKD